jgi:hypothetical protein
MYKYIDICINSIHTMNTHIYIYVYTYIYIYINIGNIIVGMFLVLPTEEGTDKPEGGTEPNDGEKKSLRCLYISIYLYIYMNV